MRDVNRLIALTLSALALASCDRGSRRTADDDDATQAMARLYVAARCDHRPPLAPTWCTATSGWASGSGGELGQSHALLGLRVSVGGDEDEVENQLRHHVRVQAVVVRSTRSGLWASATDVQPDTAEERGELARAAEQVQRVFDGTEESVHVGSSLYAFVTDAHAAKHEVSCDARECSFGDEHLVRLRRSGRFWVAFERAPRDRKFVSLLTDRVSADDR